MFFLLGAVIGGFVGGAILKAACWIYNHFAGTHPRDYTSPSDFQARHIGPPPTWLGPQPEASQNPFAQPLSSAPPASSPLPSPVEGPDFNPYAAPKAIAPGPSPEHLPFSGDLNHPDGVPEPSWPLAFGIVIVTYLAGLFVGFFADIAIGQMLRGQVITWAIVIPVALVRIVISVLLSSGVLCAMLPTRYARAILVVLIEAAIGLLILAVVFGIGFVGGPSR